jgi:AAHS family 4-hydroxybenzoate transporter-like MFS transporter
MAQTVDISRLIDERGVHAFNIRLVIFAFFIILFDGYDIGAAAFAAPSLIQAWHITDRAALGTMFSASLFGILFGSPIFGYVGDRFGRRIAIFASCVTFGFFTLVAVWSSSLEQITWLRFLAGIGIGGLLPNTIALTAEYAPHRFRATMIIIMFCGITFGGAVPGFVAASLVPSYGWQMLFWIGGVAPLAIALLVLFALPESLKHLVVKGGATAEVRRLVGAIDPGRTLAADTQFVVADEKQYKGFNPAYLFQDGLAAITPLLWVCFVANLMGFYFLMSWMPTLLTGANVPVTHAALATSLFQIGGTLGGLALSRPMDLKGLIPVTILFVLAIPVVAAIGFAAQLAETTLMIVIFLGGFCVLGLQFGLNATSAMIYPTSIRSNGSGWAFAIGRFGSVAGPIVGGVLIGMHLSLQQLYLWAAVPFVIGAIASIALARLYKQRFQGHGLGQRQLLDAAAARD